MGARSMKRRFWMSLFEEKISMPDMTVKDFCKMKNVTEKSYWYFHKVLSDEIEGKLYSVSDNSDRLPVFLEVNSNDLIDQEIKTDSLNSSAVVHLDDRISISVSEDISDAFLLRLLKAVSHV